MNILEVYQQNVEKTDPASIEDRLRDIHHQVGVLRALIDRHTSDDEFRKDAMQFLKAAENNAAISIVGADHPAAAKYADAIESASIEALGVSHEQSLKAALQQREILIAHFESRAMCEEDGRRGVYKIDDAVVGFRSVDGAFVPLSTFMAEAPQEDEAYNAQAAAAQSAVESEARPAPISEQDLEPGL